MRKPTPEIVALAWWTRALAYYTRNGSMRGCDQAGVRIDDEPQAGFYKRRLVKNGPWVAARIWLDAELDEDGALASEERMRCEVGGTERDAADQWSYLSSHPISRGDYEFMLADQRWCEANAPNEPLARPGEPIDFNKLDLQF
jgi:hypothetical protein